MQFEKEILFGAAYYEEYLPYDRLEQDMELMVQAGFNVIRIAESTWSTEEPEPGKYDFSHVDRVIDAAERHGLSVIIGTPTYAVPHWLTELDPDVLAVTKNGKELYGHRQNMDITNPTYRAYAEKIIRALISHTAGRKNVIGFQLDNETKHYDTSGEHAVALFRKWMEKRYASVEELNKRLGLHYWSNAVNSFSDLPDPRGTINGSYAAEFARFQRTCAADFLKWQRAIVEEYCRPDQFITQNFDYEWREFPSGGYSWGVQPGICHYEASDAVTVMGTDIYCFDQDRLTGREIAFGGDLMRPVKKANYLVLESQAQAFKEWLPYPGQLFQMAMSHIASGACSVMYWNWFSIHNAIESYWKGILSHDFEPNPTYEEVAEIGKAFKRLSPELTGLKKKNEAAIVVSTENVDVLKWFPTAPDFTYNDGVHWIYDTLYDMNLECDVIFAKETDWSGYKLLIFPQLYLTEEGLVERIRAFTEAGGTVFATFRSFFTDDRVKIYPDRQPHGLTEVFGMTYNQYTNPDQVTVGGAKARYWMELLKPDTAKAVDSYEHQYWGGYAAVTRNEYGKGHAWYLGTYLPESKLKEYLKQAAADAGISLQAYAFPLILRTCETPDGNCLRFIFNYSRETIRTVLEWNGYDLLSDRDYHAGEQAELKDWGVMILKEH